MNGIKIENEEYHASERLSWSKLKHFLKSPLDYKHRFLDGNDSGPTAAMEFGSLVHCLALEPELFKRDYVVWTGTSRSTKAGKEEWAMIERDGRIAVKEADLDHALNVSRAALTVLPPGDTEVAFYATIEGVECQCKVDRIEPLSGQLFDIKTCADIHKFKRGMEFGDWLLGDTFYRMVIDQSSNFLPPPVRYIGVQTTAPHDVLVLHYPADLYEASKEVVLGHLRRFAKCKATDTWPGVAGGATDAQEVQVNDFALGRLGIEQPTLDDMFSDEYNETQSI